MSLSLERNCVVLVQYRSGSDYNDFVGKYYHFPSKYLNLLKNDNIEFIYYEPKSQGGKGEYFGCGRLGKISTDKREKDQHFVEILDYKLFTQPIGLRSQNNELREDSEYYNPQNAVRRISPNRYDDICLDGEIQLSFKADAHLIQVLGEELIASESVGILELIKNSYDANASYCSIYIYKLDGLPETPVPERYRHLDGPIIVIEDDGCGMDRVTVENGWMRPASVIKTNVKQRIRLERAKALESNNLGVYDSLISELKSAHKGRIPLGEKGVGRFATHRLGDHLRIETKTASMDYEYVLNIDWGKFISDESSSPVDLDSVGFGLGRQQLTRNYGERGSGTRLVIYGGKRNYSLTPNTIKDISRSVLKLRSPNADPDSFKAVLHCEQVSELDEKDNWEEYPPVFSFDAIVDENGIADIKLKFTPPSSVPMPDTTFEDSSFDLRRTDDVSPEFWYFKGKKRKPCCGPFLLHIDLWYRAKPWIDGPSNSNFFSYLDAFGGISIFRDGINIFPAEWGAEVDWLNLSKRHIKKGTKLSYYNMIGNLELDQTSNIDLIDKTDRQGLMANTAFHDLKRLVRNAIFLVENEYKGKRDQFTNLSGSIYREPRILSDVSKQSSSVLSKLAVRYDTVNDDLDILSGLGKASERKATLSNLSASLANAQKSLKAMQEVRELLTEQAGYGLTIGVAVHEVSKLTSSFYNVVSNAVKSELDQNVVDEMKSITASLRLEIRRLGPMRAIRNERRSVFSVKKLLKFVQSIYKRKLAKLGVELNISKGDFNIFARYGALVQVICNLIENSCYWLSEVKKGQRRILIEIAEDARSITVADNGPDISESIRPYLFEPGYSLKVPPSGLGLYICKHYMGDMKGNIFLTPSSLRLDNYAGAQFSLDFSRVSAEKD